MQEETYYKDTDDFFYFRTRLQILYQRNPQEAHAELHARFVSDSTFRNWVLNSFTKEQVEEMRETYNTNPVSGLSFDEWYNFIKKEGIILTNKVTVEDLMLQKEIHIKDYTICF